MISGNRALTGTGRASAEAVGGRCVIMSRADEQQKQADGKSVGEKAGLVQGLVSIVSGYAGREDFPPHYHLLIIFGCIFVLVMLVGDRDPSSVAIMSASVLAAYLVVFLLNEVREHRESAKRKKDAAKLRCFLGLSERKGEVRFYVPVVEAEHHPSQDLTYRVDSLALGDVRAVVEILSSLVEFGIISDSETINPSRLFIKENVVRDFRAGALFLVGGPIPNRHVRTMLSDNPHIRFEDWGGEIGIVLKDDPSRRFTMKPPRGERSIDDALAEPTYGCVVKAVEKHITRLAIWGLDARGTVGAAHWLTSHWRTLKEDFDIEPDQPFTVVLRLGPEKDLHADKPSREPGRLLLLPADSSP
jgi:hypothetical protein